MHPFNLKPTLLISILASSIQMKFSLLPLAALLYLTTAQLDSLPPCAKQCANNLPQQCTNGGSSIGLIQCICSDKSWLEGISCCVKDKCSASDIQCMFPMYQTISTCGDRRLTWIFSDNKSCAAALCHVCLTILLLGCLANCPKICPPTLSRLEIGGWC